jgi:ABC-type transport system involved in multi-copper enzyme maturation permease subunit
MAIGARLRPDNPVLVKEMRVRMRGARAYWILFGYLGFLALVLLLNYFGWLNQVQNRGVGASEASRIGAEMFNWVMVTQVFLVLFITPAITSGSLTIEKEQRTLDMLTMTRLSRRSIIAGKLLSAVAFTALLLVSSLPLISICFMLGSVDPGMVVSSYLLLLMGSLLVGAMGLMWSSIARSTSAAVLYTYATLILPVFLGFGTVAALMSPNSNSDLAFQIFRAIGETWFGNRFFGLQVPTGLGFAVFCVLGGLLLSAIAMTNIESYPERRAPLLRGLTLLVLGVQLLSLTLWWLQAWYNRAAQAVQIQVDPPLTSLIITGTLLLLLIPIFATGDLRPDEARRFPRYLAGGWTPQGLRQGRMASGLPFVLLMTLFALGLYGFGFVLVGHAGDILRSGAASNPTTPQVTQAQTAPVPPDGVAAPPGQAPKSAAAADPLAGDFPQAALVLLVSAGGFALLCMLFSVAFRNRWVALCLAYLFLLWIWVGPELARVGANSETPPGPSINLYYFNPVQSLIQMSSLNGGRGNYFDSRPLLLSTTPMWQVTTYLWLLVGGLSLALMLPLASRRTQAGH